MRFARIIAVAALALRLGGAANAQSTGYPFPLSQGTTWVYSGVVRYGIGGNDGAESKVTGKTEVVRVIRRDGLQAAVVRGFPSDLDWSDGKVKPQDTLIIRSSQNKFYLIGHASAAAALQRLDDATDSLKGLLKDDDLFLRVPLEKGSKFCDSEGMARTDAMYCWVVDAVEQRSFGGIAGIGQSKMTAYSIAYRTNPDTEEYVFVPEVGIVHYEYHHHGTVADTELSLVEFHPGH